MLLRKIPTNSVFPNVSGFVRLVEEQVQRGARAAQNSSDKRGIKISMSDTGTVQYGGHGTLS